MYLFIYSLACLNNSFVASEELSAFLKTQLSYPYVNSSTPLPSFLLSINLFSSHLFPLLFLCRYLHLITIITKVHLVLVMFYGGSVVSDGITSINPSHLFLPPSPLPVLPPFLLLPFSFFSSNMFSVDQVWNRIMLGYIIIITNNIIYGTSSPPLLFFSFLFLS